MGRKLIVAIKVLNSQSLNSAIPHLRISLTEVPGSICKDIYETTELFIRILCEDRKEGGHLNVHQQSM